MLAVDSESAYAEYVQTVARNRAERDPSRCEYVAEICVCSIVKTIDDEIVFSTVPAPYHDTTITPTAVLRNTDQSIEGTDPTNFREAAVHALAQDIRSVDVDVDVDVEENANGE